MSTRGSATARPRCSALSAAIAPPPPVSPPRRRSEATRPGRRRSAKTVHTLRGAPFPFARQIRAPGTDVCTPAPLLRAAPVPKQVQNRPETGIAFCRANWNGLIRRQARSGRPEQVDRGGEGGTEACLMRVDGPAGGTRRRVRRTGGSGRVPREVRVSLLGTFALTADGARTHTAEERPAPRRPAGPQPARPAQERRRPLAHPPPGDRRAHGRACARRSRGCGRRACRSLRRTAPRCASTPA